MPPRRTTSRARGGTTSARARPESVRVTILRGVVAAERALGERVSAGPVPDIISRATSVFRDAKKALDAPEAAVRAAGRTAANAIKDAVLGAVRRDRDAVIALGQGARELVSDVESFVAGPIVIAVLLYLITR